MKITKGEKVVDLRKTVEVVGTGKANSAGVVHLKKDVKYKVSPLQVDGLKKKGFIKMIALLFACMLALGLNAQSTITSDTISGAETVSFALGQFVKTVQTVCTTVSGTVDTTTLEIHGSIDNTNWTQLNFVGGVNGTAAPQGNLSGNSLNVVTQANGRVSTWTINTNYWPYLKLVGTGAAGEVSIISGKFTTKSWRDR